MGNLLVNYDNLYIKLLSNLYCSNELLSALLVAAWILVVAEEVAFCM